MLGFIFVAFGLAAGLILALQFLMFKNSVHGKK